MPEDTVPDGPIPGARQAGWFLRFFTSLTAQQTLPLVLVFLVGWLLYNGFQDKQIQQARDDERYAEQRRDRFELEERSKQREIEITRMVLTHCASQEKIRRDDSLTHMRESLGKLEKLDMAIQALTNEIARLKKPLALEVDPIKAP